MDNKRNSPLLHGVIAEFSKLLDVRLKQDVYTTEDSIRYTFFAALLEVGDIRPDQVILEYAHPAIQRARIDTWITSLDGEAVAIEFKYHREIPSGKNSPRPMKAGQLFHDLKRLTLIEHSAPARSLLVFVTDEEMAAY